MPVTIRTTISALVVGTLLVGTAARTTSQRRDDGRVRVDTLEGGRIVVSNPYLPQAGPEGVPALFEALRIGSTDGHLRRLRPGILARRGR